MRKWFMWGHRNIKKQIRIDSKDIPNWSKSLFWLKLCLSSLVVLLHTNIESTHFAYLEVKHVINIVADLATPAFFCVSAYCFFRNYKQNQYFAILHKKAIRLLIPYFAWNVLGYIYKLSLQFVLDNSTTLFSIKGLLLSEYNSPLWFVRVLFEYVLLSPLFFVCIQKKTLSLTVILGSMVLNYLICPSYSSMLFWLPVYLLGAMCAFHYRERIETEELSANKRKILRIVFGVCLLLVVIGGVLAFNRRVYYFYRMIGSVLVVACFGLKLWHGIPSSIWQNSFFVFCSHALVVGPVKAVCHLLCPSSTVWDVFVYFCCAGMILGITTLAGELIKKYAPFVVCCLTGVEKGIKK